MDAIRLRSILQKHGVTLEQWEAVVGDGLREIPRYFENLGEEAGRNIKGRVNIDFDCTIEVTTSRVRRSPKGRLVIDVPPTIQVETRSETKTHKETKEKKSKQRRSSTKDKKELQSPSLVEAKDMEEKSPSVEEV